MVLRQFNLWPVFGSCFTVIAIVHDGCQFEVHLGPQCHFHLKTNFFGTAECMLSACGFICLLVLG